jgi:hypothetical protein
MKLQVNGLEGEIVVPQFVTLLKPPSRPSQPLLAAPLLRETSSRHQ